jgi:predicted regulator of Ras-like GTPase activity (Roadblock/LC7/MglB family)
MFLDKLSRVSNRIPGARALCLVDGDGIPVDSVAADPQVDLDLLAAELVARVRAISDDRAGLAVGEVEQLSVITDRLTVVVSSIGAGYFLLLVLGPEGSYGRARFELRRARLLLRDELT